MRPRVGAGVLFKLCSLLGVRCLADKSCPSHLKAGDTAVSEDSCLLQRVPAAQAQLLVQLTAPLGETGGDVGVAQEASKERSWLRMLLDYYERGRAFATELVARTRARVRMDRESSAYILGFVLMSILVQLVLVALVAHFYIEVVRVAPEVDDSKRGADLRHWSSSLLLGMCTDARICICSCCCPCVRWADNLHMLGIMSFWAALWLAVASILLAELTDSLFWWLLPIGLVFFRQRIRRKFKMERTGWQSQVADFASYCFCLPCTIAQDARHIQEACMADDPAVLQGTLLHFES